MTEFFSRKYGNKGYEVIIKTDCREHYRASEEFARRLIDHAKPMTDNNVGSKWIPVTERLPDKDGTYIVCTTTGAVTTARFYVGKTYPPTRYRHTEYHSPTKWQSNRNVTHWMPLPEPPKEVE